MKRILIYVIAIVLGGLALLAIIGALSDRDPRNGVPVQDGRDRIGAPEFNCAEEIGDDLLARLEELGADFLSLLGIRDADDVRDLNDTECRLLRRELEDLPDKGGKTDTTPTPTPTITMEETEEAGEPDKGASTPTPSGEGSEDFFGGQAGSRCYYDQIGVFAQDSAGNRERMEVGGGGMQIVVYTPGGDVPTVAYLIGTREQPATWWGFGTIIQLTGCEDLDYDTVKRIVNEHRLAYPWSGLIVDLRGTEPEYCNFGSMSQQELDDLVALHLREMRKPKGDA